MNWDQDRKLHSGDPTNNGSFTGGSNVTLALPAALRQVKENVQSILLNHINTFFSSCDDLFFDLAKKAANNKEQNLYFDSMREVRIRKNDVINNFKREYETLFKDLSKAKVATEETRPTMETLNLVANDEMEQNVAISGIVGKARATYQEELYHLTCRLDYLLQNIKVNESNNPLDPAQLCSSFSRALKPLDVEFTARIILLKQFDRVVVKEFGQVYRLANELLIASGILPKIRNSIVNPQIGMSAGIKAVADTGTAAALAGEQGSLDAAMDSVRAYEMVTNMIGAMRSMGVTLPNDIRNLYRDMPMGPVLPASELQGFLSSQQNHFTGGDGTPLDLRQLIFNGLVAMGQPDQPRSLEQADEDIINLVAMFFDFVLDDSSLPVPIQALVARLQIPVLKVALNDNTFFSNQNHAVRRFINEIAAASIGWDDSDKERQDNLFEITERLVHKILNSFQGDVHLFDECYDELKSFVAEEQKRASLVEKRTSEAAVGKAKMDHARGQVQKMLWNRLHDTSLPTAVWDLLVNDWQKLLIHTLLKYGQDCQEWVDAIQFVDDICWFCARHSDEKSRQRMTRLLPLLLTRAENGYKRLSIPEDSANSRVERLRSFLDSLIKGNNVPPYHAITAEFLLELGQNESAAGKSWKEMTALERQQIKHQAITYEFLKKADELRVGSWVTYTTNDTGRTTRCKLAAKIDATEQLVFVNRFGFKLLEKSKRQFAQDMQLGQVKLLESGLIFDRAMSNIATSLKKISPPGRQVS